MSVCLTRHIVVQTLLLELSLKIFSSQCFNSLKVRVYTSVMKLVRFVCARSRGRRLNPQRRTPSASCAYKMTFIYHKQIRLNFKRFCQQFSRLLQLNIQMLHRPVRVHPCGRRLICSTPRRSVICRCCLLGKHSETFG